MLVPIFLSKSYQKLIEWPKYQDIQFDINTFDTIDGSYTKAQYFNKYFREIWLYFSKISGLKHEIILNQHRLKYLIDLLLNESNSGDKK